MTLAQSAEKPAGENCIRADQKVAHRVGRSRSAGHLDERHDDSPAASGEVQGREFLTSEERAAQDKDTEIATDKRHKVGTAQDVEDAYNGAWWDRGRSDGRTSLIYDPPDGLIPPLTPAAQKRIAALAETGRLVRRRARHRHLRRPRIGGSVPSLHHSRAAAAFSHGLRQQLSDRARTGIRRDHAGADSRDAHHSDRWACAFKFGRPPMARRFPRSLGRRNTRRRDDQLQRRGDVPERDEKYEADRTLDAHRRRSRRLPLHRERSRDVDQAVVGVDPVE